MAAHVQRREVRGSDEAENGAKGSGEKERQGGQSLQGLPLLVEAQEPSPELHALKITGARRSHARRQARRPKIMVRGCKYLHPRTASIVGAG